MYGTKFESLSYIIPETLKAYFSTLQMKVAHYASVVVITGADSCLIVDNQSDRNQ